MEGAVAEHKANNEQVHLSDLEEQLIIDDDGSLREQLLKDLVDEAMQLKSEQNKGLSPDEFDRNSSMITAILAAAEVVEQTWSKHHGKG
nr:EscE/YscE/SsaE family type III secretion system needle protein co-chaperone [Endozoicomonas sp. OPT23]